MACFTVRVELHGATPQDYEHLHAAMSGEGFSRTIRADDGQLYKLPTAEYDLTNSGLPAERVHGKAKAAAQSTGRGADILVTEAVRRVWTLAAAPEPVNALAAFLRSQPQPNALNTFADLGSLLGQRPPSILDHLR